MEESEIMASLFKLNSIHEFRWSASLYGIIQKLQYIISGLTFSANGLYFSESLEIVLALAIFLRYAFMDNM